MGLSLRETEIVVRGNSNENSQEGFVLFYLQDSKILAADCVNRPKEFQISKNLVKNKSRVPAAILSDDSIDPMEFKNHVY